MVAAASASRAASISLVQAVSGATSDTTSGTGVTRDADSVTAAGGYEAHARLGIVNGHLTGGVMARTNGDEQVASAKAHVESTWGCPVGNCLEIGVFDAPMYLRVSFDGVLDPLILMDPSATGAVEMSMDVRFNYDFPEGSFEFNACYRPGTAFDRAESGCIDLLAVSYFDKVTHQTTNLTSLLQFGPGNAVSFDYTLPWSVTGNTWIDSYDISVKIQSIDSAGPHVLDFLNTFGVQQTSGDPRYLFTTGDGLISGVPTADGQVPEPASLLLLGTGLAMIRRRKGGVS